MKLAVALVPGLALLLATTTGPLAAQILPDPGPSNPRLQTVAWQSGQRIILTALPMTGLTVVLEPGERILGNSLAFPAQWDWRLSAERDSFHVTPTVPDAESALTVLTDRRQYLFTLQTGDNLNAALLVQVLGNDTGPDFPPAVGLPTAPPAPLPSAYGPAAPGAGSIWSYRVGGDRVVRPQYLSDDGRRTRILFAPDQALPAIFAIGPTGKEEVVNGYMRGEAYEIDRVYDRLVFRIDREKATARRRDEPGNAR